MFYPGGNYGFSVSVVSRSKARPKSTSSWRAIRAPLRARPKSTSSWRAIRAPLRAQCEGNGYSLAPQGHVVEHWNADAGHYRDALRVSLSTPMGCVAPLDKGITIACEPRLAVRPEQREEVLNDPAGISVNVDKLTELAITAGIEY